MSLAYKLGIKGWGLNLDGQEQGKNPVVRERKGVGRERDNEDYISQVGLATLG